MPNKNHREAQGLAIEAASLIRAGDIKNGEAKYRDAAIKERVAIECLPKEAIRTRGILAVSLVSMLYKARAYDEAERCIYRFLSEEAQTPSARRELRNLLDVIGDEKVIAGWGSQYSGEEIMVALRKGRIGYGTAPMDAFLHNAAGFNSLYYRVAEWQGGFPFRQRGLPPMEVLQSFQARVTQPIAGSYRFTIRLLEPNQLEMFSGPRVNPTKVADAMIQIVRHTADGDTKGLRAIVPDTQYCQTMAKLVRNLIPMGKGVGEVELSRISGQLADRQNATALLVPETRDHVSRIISSFVPPPVRGTEIKGILRALDLDKGWIEVATDGQRRHFKTERGNLFDDVVSPMVNRRVVVRSYVGKRGTLVVDDIELDQTAEDEQ